MKEITKEEIQNFSQSSKKEWLISNGIGGYASSTILGLNTRKYHALLVAALGNSTDRYVVLSRLNESLEMDEKEYTLSTNECSNFIENGYKRQEYFRKAFLPEFCYKVNDVQIVKKIAMKYGENKVAIIYHIKNEGAAFTFKIQPLVNYRSFHDTRKCSFLDSSYQENMVNVKLNSHGNYLHMGASYDIVSDSFSETYPCEFIKYDRTYYRNMFYRVEEERGLDAYEDHFMPGEYQIMIPKKRECFIEFVASVDDCEDYFTKVNGAEIIRRENTRLEKICKVANATDDCKKELVIAADTFIVQRGTRKTLIAGYPWFGDWGRDTFIAFEGILLKTNRLKEAKEVLMSFSQYIKHGLIPNFIGEDGGEAYNTVDASLWYIDAVHKYYQYTYDEECIMELFPKLKSIIDAYQNGTDYDIKMDPEDCLISAGNSNTQLTWMDAKVGDYIPTPRNGKAVEINALWYNALKIMEGFAMEFSFEFDFEISKRVKDSFHKFYVEKGLFDVIEPYSQKIRPNQIIAIGLYFSPVDDEKAREILDLVEEKLYTDKGLKTLASEDPEFRPYYVGGVYQRDSSYHQGTVWPWLLMPYFYASKRYGGKYQALEELDTLLTDDCLGSIAEIYDAEEPRSAKGAFSQAWSVSMALLNISK